MCACLVRPALHRSRSDRQPEVIVCFGVPPPDFVRCLTPSAPPQRSNFGGLAFPFLREKLAGRMDCTIRAVEPEACPSLTQGVFEYDFGDTAGLTPLLKVGDPPPPKAFHCWYLAAGKPCKAGVLVQCPLTLWSPQMHTLGAQFIPDPIHAGG